MLSFLPSPLIGILVAVFFLLNIIIAALLIILAGLIELLIPVARVKRLLVRLQNDFFPSVWTDINGLLLKLFTKTQLVVSGQGDLNRNHWYFVFANHRTWADIVVLQLIFNHKIPMLKFFLKKELLWSLPMGGLACWMLDFPFMKRYSKTYLKKHPEKRNQDIKTTQAACLKFKRRPTTVMNFLEGTRFTPEKRQDRSSPYKHLLRPKSGGLAFVISEMRGFIKEVVDVTIVYDHASPTFWNFLCGKISKITLNYRVLSLDAALYGEYYQDPQFRRHFQGWVNTLWLQKDNLIDQIGIVEEQHEINATNCHT
jgi:1-acyl-sn-glycerol-3-phosphate acyltransferase